MSTRLKDVLIFHEIGPQSAAASNTAKLYMDNTNDRLKLANAGTFAADVITRNDVFNATTSGIVPLSGGGTTNFLRADGTWAAPPGGSSIDGSGTTNHIALWSDSDTLTSSANATHDGATLTLNNGAGSVDIAIFKDNSTTVLTVGDGGILTGNVATGSTADLVWHGDTLNNLLFADVSADKVGIGTNNPGSLLSVVRSQNANTAIEVTNPTSGSGAQSSIYMVHDGAASKYGSFGVNSSGWSASQLSQPDQYVVSAASGLTSMLFATNASNAPIIFSVSATPNGGFANISERLRIDQNTIAVGTTTSPIPLTIANQSAPGAPGTGLGYLYPKTDGKLYWKTAVGGGAEYDLTSTGGGGTIDGSGAADRLAIFSDSNTLTSSSAFSVNGTALTLAGPLYTEGSIHINVSGISSDSTLNDTQRVIAVDTSLGDVTVTLPNPTSTVGGRVYTIKKMVSANQMIIDGDGFDIDGQATLTIAGQYQAVTVVSTGSAWMII